MRVNGADVDICAVIGGDERIGKRFYFGVVMAVPFFKDVQALVKSASDIKYDFRILNAMG
jgi:UDPglucose 6-dehydrogenase